MSGSSVDALFVHGSRFVWPFPRANDQNRGDAEHQDEIGYIEDPGANRPYANIQKVGDVTVLSDAVDEVAESASADAREGDSLQGPQTWSEYRDCEDTNDHCGDTEREHSSARWFRECGSEAEECAWVLCILQAHGVPIVSK
jgi:hypothetical protein